MKINFLLFRRGEGKKSKHETKAPNSYTVDKSEEINREFSFHWLLNKEFIVPESPSVEPFTRISKKENPLR